MLRSIKFSNDIQPKQLYIDSTRPSDGARVVPKIGQVKSYFFDFTVWRQPCGTALHADFYVSAASISDRKPNLKTCAAPRRTVHFNRSGVDLGDPAPDGEPESNSARFAAARFVRAIESFKHIRQIRLGDANSRVAHF